MMSLCGLRAAAARSVFTNRRWTLRTLLRLASPLGSFPALSRIAQNMEDALGLPAHDSLQLAREQLAMERVFHLFNRLYALTPEEIVTRLGQSSRCEIRSNVSITPHTGGTVFGFLHCWDYWYGVMTVLLARGPRLPGVVVRLRDPDKRDLAVAWRMERAGYTLQFVDGRSRRGIQQVVRILRSGGSAFLFADFYPVTDRTLPVRWFGRPGRLPAGPLQVATLGSAQLLLAQMRYDADCREWLEVSDVERQLTGCPDRTSPAAVQILANLVEARVREAPAQWRCWARFESYFYQAPRARAPSPIAPPN